MPAMAVRSPTIFLYGKPGCGLCHEARAIVDAIVAERVAAGRIAPAIEERDITTNDRWLEAFAFEIPVVEIGDRQLPLATSASAIRRLIGEAIDG